MGQRDGTIMTYEPQKACIQVVVEAHDFIGTQDALPDLVTQLPIWLATGVPSS